MLEFAPNCRIRSGFAPNSLRITQKKTHKRRTSKAMELILPHHARQEERQLTSLSFTFFGQHLAPLQRTPSTITDTFPIWFRGDSETWISEGERADSTAPVLRTRGEAENNRSFPIVTLLLLPPTHIRYRSFQPTPHTR